MLRIALVLSAQFFAALLTAPPAMAASGIAIPRSPAVLSPGLTEAWTVQMKPEACRIDYHDRVKAGTRVVVV